MILNSLQVNKINFDIPHNSLTLDTLEYNSSYLDIQEEYIKKFNRKKQKTFSFTKEGFFALIMSLKGKIAFSLGESEAIIRGAKMALSYGKDIVFINIQKNGELDLTNINNTFDYIFISSYIIDTFVKIDLVKIKKLTNAKIISNITSNMSLKTSDILLLDGYKLTKQGELGVILYNDEFEDSTISEINLSTLYMCLEGIKQQKRNNEIKTTFLQKFKDTFKDDLFLFVNPDICLKNTLHIGLKNIKARELIRTLSLDEIYLSNGEGCSLGLMQPSRVIREMGYSESESRWCLALDFSFDVSESEVDEVVLLIYKKYRQIKILKEN
jgi:hypothetical protein